MTRNLFLGLLLILISSVVQAQMGTQTATAEMSGAWYNPQRSGEGIFLEMLDNDRAVVSWFTYDQQGRQVWLVGVGQVEQNQIVNMEMTITHGAKFGGDFLATDVVREAWGVLTLEFFTCNTARLTYTTDTVFGQGTIELSRLTSIQNHVCNQNRDFLLGFTPFPAENTSAGVDTAYQIIKDHADIIAHHFDNGVPWPEMLDQAAFTALPEAIQQDWTLRKSKTSSADKVYVAITPIAIGRDGLAPYRGKNADTPLAEIGEPWVSATFNHPDVIQAYKNYAQVVVEYFRPDYLAIGIEVNLLAGNNPDEWQAYVKLNRETYLYLHRLYPGLPIFVSFFANDFYPGITDSDPAEQIARFREIEPHTDYFALSAYPYLSALLTDSFPLDYFSVLDAISRKPLAIAESGYLAQSIALDFGNGETVSFDSNPQKQSDWIQFLLEQAEQRDFRFVINFINKDYDLLCQQIGCDDVSRLWQDSGLVDENNDPRPALTIWDTFLARDYMK